MKKIILAFFVSLFFTVCASAQTSYMPVFQFGAKGGADYSSFPSYTGFTNKNEIGYIGGFWANLTFFNVIDFQPEIYGTEKRTDVTFGQPGNMYSEKSQITSVDVPLLFGGRFGNANLSARIYTGPLLSLAVSKVQSFTNDNLYIQRLDYPDENIAWQFGAGVNIKNFTIDVRYEAGINKVTYGPEINPVTNTQISSTHLNVFSLSIGYTLFSSFGGDTYQ